MPKSAEDLASIGSRTDMLEIEQKNTQLRDARRLPASLTGMPLGWLALAVGLVACRTVLTPSTGLDQGWITGLNVAHGHKLTFGRSLIFTYGPWGFLVFPPVTSRGHVFLGVVFVAAAVATAFSYF